MFNGSVKWFTCFVSNTEHWSDDWMISIIINFPPSVRSWRFHSSTSFVLLHCRSIGSIRFGTKFTQTSLWLSCSLHPTCHSILEIHHQRFHVFRSIEESFGERRTSWIVKNYGRGTKGDVRCVHSNRLPWTCLGRGLYSSDVSWKTECCSCRYSYSFDRGDTLWTSNKTATNSRKLWWYIDIFRRSLATVSGMGTGSMWRRIEGEKRNMFHLDHSICLGRFFQRIAGFEGFEKARQTSFRRENRWMSFRSM